LGVTPASTSHRVSAPSPIARAGMQGRNTLR
jgi:hypothetical protein